MTRHHRRADWTGVAQWAALIAAATTIAGLFTAYVATGAHLADIAVLFRIR